MAKTLQEITNIIVEFCDKRGWKNERPNDLIGSVLIELGELAEHYQWKNQFEIFDDEKKREVGYEFVDILFYLFRLSYNSGIDIEKYFDEKLPKLEKKFPVNAKKGEWHKAHEEYRKTGKNKTYED